MRTPTKATLKKYGLTLDEWIEMYDQQQGKCAVCEKVPSSGIYHVDHKHVPKYKHLPPEIKRRYVRGLLCQYCNRFYLSRNMTRQKAANIIKYLEQFEERITLTKGMK